MDGDRWNRCSAIGLVQLDSTAQLRVDALDHQGPQVFLVTGDRH